MMVAKVKGNIVCSHKADKLKGHKLLIIQQVEARTKKPVGKPFVATDVAQAGVGDLVLVARHGSAVSAIFNDKIPCNAVVVGVIDEIHFE